MKNQITIVCPTGNGHYSVSINYRKKSIHCTSTNSSAWDRTQRTDMADRQKHNGITMNQAFDQFRNECILKNKKNNKFIPVERKYIIAHTPDYHSTNFVCFRTDQEIMNDKYDHDETKRILSLRLNEGRQIAYGIYCLRIQ